MNIDSLTALVRQLARQGDRKAMAANSFGAFHHRNLTYLNLLRTPDLTIKLYDIKATDGMLVQPHTHRYCFQTWVLRGQMTNIRFTEEDDGGWRFSNVDAGLWHRTKYRTPLDGKAAESEYEGQVRLFHFPSPLICRGGYYAMDDVTAHTIQVFGDTLLLLFQYRNVPKGHTVLYTRDGQMPDLTGLYQPFTEAEFSERLDGVLARLT